MRSSPVSCAETATESVAATGPSGTVIEAVLSVKRQCAAPAPVRGKSVCMPSPETRRTAGGVSPKSEQSFMRDQAAPVSAKRTWYAPLERRQQAGASASVPSPVRR